MIAKRLTMMLVMDLSLRQKKNFLLSLSLSCHLRQSLKSLPARQILLVPQVCHL
jgi:hypothetical protein